VRKIANVVSVKAGERRVKASASCWELLSAEGPLWPGYGVKERFGRGGDEGFSSGVLGDGSLSNDPWGREPLR